MYYKDYGIFFLQPVYLCSATAIFPKQTKHHYCNYKNIRWKTSFPSSSPEICRVGLKLHAKLNMFCTGIILGSKRPQRTVFLYMGKYGTYPMNRQYWQFISPNWLFTKQTMTSILPKYEIPLLLFWLELIILDHRKCVNITCKHKKQEQCYDSSYQWNVNKRWFKYDQDWFVCKQAALRSSCATLREWSHNLHPPSCSG